jgi:ATP-dependent protease HslVU (ClpYQ) ATPase subunit
LIRQQIELIETEGVKLVFEDDAIRSIARMAAQLNKTVENIGARRLHTVIERIMETLSFDAAEQEDGTVRLCYDGSCGNEESISVLPRSSNFFHSCLYIKILTVTKDLVEERLKDVTMKADISRYIL